MRLSLHHGAWAGAGAVCAGLVVTMCWVTVSGGASASPRTSHANAVSAVAAAEEAQPRPGARTASSGATVPEWSSADPRATQKLSTKAEASLPQEDSGASQEVVVPSRKSLPMVLPKTSNPVEGADSYRAPQLEPPASGTAVTGAQPGQLAMSGQAVSRPEVLALIAEYFPADQVDAAARVSVCESGQRNITSAPNTDGTRDHGIFQINDGGTFQELARRLGDDPGNVALALDPRWNVRAAAVLYSARGWQPWTCARKLGLA